MGTRLNDVRLQGTACTKLLTTPDTASFNRGGNAPRVHEVRSAARWARG